MGFPVCFWINESENQDLPTEKIPVSLQAIRECTHSLNKGISRTGFSSTGLLEN